MSPLCLQARGTPGSQYSTAPGSQKVCDSGILLFPLLFSVGQRMLFDTLGCIKAYRCFMYANNMYVIKLAADVQAKLL